MRPKTENNKPDLFVGKHDRGVDQSRRVLLPSEWRPQGSSAELMILLWPLRAPSHLLVLPPDRWRMMLQNLGSASLTNETAAAAERFISSHCYSRSLDNYGRLPIPDEAAKTVGIEGNAVLLGRFDKFEIWCPERYEANNGHLENQRVMENLNNLQL
jgi:division/cell wall cluster transcriptional repressor MraZ